MIFITGPHSAGKTTIARELEVSGFFHIETGEIVKRLHLQIAPETDFHEWATENQHGFDSAIAAHIQTAQAEVGQAEGRVQDLVITGNRQNSGIYYLEGLLSLDGRPNLVIYVEADEQTLYERHACRPRNTDGGLTFRIFKQDVLGFDEAMGLNEIRNRADMVVCNEGCLETCVEGVKTFLEDYGYQFDGREVEGNSGRKEAR